MNRGAFSNGLRPGVGQIIHQLASGGDHRVALARVFQRRKRDGRQQSDDHEDNNQLDEREAGASPDSATRRRRLQTERLVRSQSDMERDAHYQRADQLRMLSLFTPSLAGMAGSAWPSGPKDQTITGAFNSQGSELFFRVKATRSALGTLL